MAEEIEKACQTLTNCDRKLRDSINEMRKMLHTASERDKFAFLHGLNGNIQAMEYQINFLAGEKTLLLKEYQVLRIESENDTVFTLLAPPMSTSQIPSSLPPVTTTQSSDETPPPNPPTLTGFHSRLSEVVQDVKQTLGRLDAFPLQSQQLNDIVDELDWIRAQVMEVEQRIWHSTIIEKMKHLGEIMDYIDKVLAYFQEKVGSYVVAKNTFEQKV